MIKIYTILTCFLRSFLTSILSFLLCGTLYATPISEIIFFGDSLTDNGNLYSLIKIIPQSPPYYQGRFSNGPTWAEYLGSHYQNLLGITYSNYAYGGATAIYHDPSDDSFSVITLEGELYNYYANSFFSDKTNNLYVIWIGANDYLYDSPQDAEGITTEVVDKISWAITSLVGQGAQNFLILNLPDLAKIPFASLHHSAEYLHQLSVLHNQKLEKAVNALSNLSSKIKIISINTYDILNDILNNTESYNQKYKIHLKNLNQACWQGGLIENYPLNDSQSKIDEQKLNYTLALQNKPLLESLHSSHLIDQILKSPILKQAYFIAKFKESGMSSCDHPDEYFFWDDVHPTKVTHELIAAITSDMLNNQAIDLFS